MATEAIQLVGVEKLSELGHTVTMADADEAFEAMLSAAKEAGTIALPRLDNCISYAARDNEGKWYQLDQTNKWSRYEGPGRKPKAE